MMTQGEVKNFRIVYPDIRYIRILFIKLLHVSEIHSMYVLLGKVTCYVVLF